MAPQRSSAQKLKEVTRLFDALSDIIKANAIGAWLQRRRNVVPWYSASRGLGQLVAAATSAVRQTLPTRELAVRHPEAWLAAMDAKWWMIAQFDSVVVSMPDGTSASSSRASSAKSASISTRIEPSRRPGRIILLASRNWRAARSWIPAKLAFT